MTLNATVEVLFIPAFSREEGPQRLVEEPSTEDEVRRMQAATCGVVGTPDSAPAGEKESFRDAETRSKRSVLFVSDAEFAAFEQELSPLVTEFVWGESGDPISGLHLPAFAEFLRARVLVPDVLTKYELAMLGR